MEIRKAWCLDTCHPAYRTKWSPENPAVGQCLVTALYLHDLYGGSIWKCKVGSNSHFINILPCGTIIDMTKSQFKDKAVVYKNLQKCDVGDLLKNKDTLARFVLLKARISKGDAD